MIESHPIIGHSATVQTELDRIGYDCHANGKKEANKKNNTSQMIVGKNKTTDYARYPADSIVDYQNPGNVVSVTFQFCPTRHGNALTRSP